MVSAIDYLREVPYLWLICIIMPTLGFLLLFVLRRLFEIPEISKQNNEVHNYQQDEKPYHSEIQVIRNNCAQSQSNKKADYSYQSIFESLFAHIKCIIGKAKALCQPKKNDTESAYYGRIQLQSVLKPH